MPETPRGDAEEIGLWEARVVNSARMLKERAEVFETTSRWYRTKYHMPTLALNRKDEEMREVNITLAFVRALQSGLFSQHPRYSCTSPWRPTEVREAMSLAVTRHMRRAFRRRDAKKLILQNCLAGYGVLQVGYQNETVWSESLEEEQRELARRDVERLLLGERVRAKKEHDHGVHIDELTQALAQWQQELGPDGQELYEPVSELIKEHRVLQAESSEAPRRLGDVRQVWVRRVPLFLHGDPAFGWEPETAFEEARWLWRRWIRPLDEVKENPYYRRKVRRQLQPNRSRNESLFPGRTPPTMLGEGQGYDPDAELVEGLDLLDRHRGRYMSWQMGGPDFLFEETYPYGDIFESSGFHKFSLIDDPDDMGPGISPIEPAASQIITINENEHRLSALLRRAAPITIVDQSVIGEDELDDMMELEGGDYYSAKGNLNRSLKEAFYEVTGAAMRSEHLMPLARAEAQLGMILGPGEPRMGGGESSKTATAAAVVSQSTTEFMVEWAARIEEGLEDVAVDVCQLMKRFYRPQDWLDLVSQDRAQALSQGLDPNLAFKLDDFKVDVGSSMPGQSDTRTRKLMELAQVMGGSPLTRRRKLEEKIWRAAGEDPEEMMMSREEEAQMAQQQMDTESSQIHGSPELPMDAAADAGGQNREDVNNMVRQNAGRLSRAAQ